MIESTASMSYTGQKTNFVDASQNAFSNNESAIGDKLLPRTEIQISSYDDDPFVSESTVERISPEAFNHDHLNMPFELSGPKVKVSEGLYMGYLQDDGSLVRIANNPWTDAKPDDNGDFVFWNEPRFPELDRDLDENGDPPRDNDGLQIWNTNDYHIAQTTPFETLHATSEATSEWAGKDVSWGNNGILKAAPHEFVGANAYFNPEDKGLHFGIIPMQDQESGDVRFFEVAASFEVAAHEAGHAAHHELKPNVQLLDPGFRMWGEAFGDSMSMWVGLQDPDRAKYLIKKTGGDLSIDNVVTKMGEGFANALNIGASLRNVRNDETMDTVSQNPYAYHDRSKVLTGASWNVFTGIVEELINKGEKQEDAVMKAADIMGKTMTRAADFTPENQMTPEDVAKGYLLADKEYFNGNYQSLWIKEFKDRKLLDDNFQMDDLDLSKTVNSYNSFRIEPFGDDSEMASRAHAKIIEKIDDLVGETFGINGENIKIDVDKEGNTIARFTLTHNRGDDAADTGNQGLIAWRADGNLMSMQKPLPNTVSENKAQELFENAKEKNLHTLDSPMQIFINDETKQPSVRVTKSINNPVPQFLVHTIEKPDGKLFNYLEVQVQSQELKKLSEEIVNSEEKSSRYKTVNIDFSNEVVQKNDVKMT